VGKFILRLLHKPAFGAAAEHLGQAHGHFGGYAALLVHQFRQRRARHAQSGGGIRYAQAQRLDALAQYEAAGVRGFFIGIVSSSINGNRRNQRPARRRLQNEKSPASWRVP
jgi:hypothetical protein